MPELPEAETIVRGLRPRLTGRRILEARFLARRVSRNRPEELVGCLIEGVRRHGKQVLLELDDRLVVFKLGMTGSLLLNKDPGPYTRAMFVLDHGCLCFDDIRQFGSIGILPKGTVFPVPDALEIDAGEFVARLRQRNTEVKRLLLDQSFARGIGNIYADEALFRARIHPKARTRRIGVKRGRRLHQAVVNLLRLAIEQRGSSVSNYVDAAGNRGEFQLLHQVYRRTGEPCTRCGRPIRRIVLGGRGTHYCPVCQRV